MYLEQVGTEKRAINTVDVYYKYQLIYNKNQHFLHDLFKRIYYNKIGNILKVWDINKDIAVRNKNISEM
jgi:hypothetical protein